MNDCKRCLLREAGENASYRAVADYLSTLSDGDRVDEKTYAYRLSFCKSCDNLIAGMCIKCGCYAELRAALRQSSCADYDSRFW